MWQYLAFLGVVFNLLAAYSYIVDTLRGRTKPNRVSWLLWTLIPMIAVAASLVKQPSWAALPVFMCGFADLLIFLASFVNPNAYWKLTVLDWICGTCSVLAIVLWALTKEPGMATLFCIAGDTLAAIPTLVKGWKEPHTETAKTFVLAFFGALTSFPAMRNWSFAECGFPIYLLVMTALLFLSIVGGRARERWFSGRS
jgi:hypothetical protein